MSNFTEEQIKEAMRHTIPPYVNNLRGRSKAIKNDCFIRGTLAEIYLRDFFKNYGFYVKSNILNNCVDIDLQIITNFNKSINIEIKTSLIPYKGFDIYKSADLKIYKKTDNIADDIKWDIGIQVYFNKFKGDWENFIEESDNKLIYEGYKNLNFSCFWITRNDAISYSNSLPSDNRTWTFEGSYKEFWKSPLSIHSNNLNDLINLLKVWK